MRAGADPGEFDDPKALQRSRHENVSTVPPYTGVNDLLVSLDGNVLSITFNRPDSLNSLTAEMVETLCSVLERAGDDPAVIASGPTVPDETTCDQALALLDRYGIEIPATVRAALQDGSLETPKPGDTVFTGHQVKMMATPMQSLQAAADAARAAGIAEEIGLGVVGLSVSYTHLTLPTN